MAARKLLVDVLREDLGLTGTHIGCEQGSCGACTVLVEGRPVRSCIMLGVQADGCDVTTVEGITPEDGLNPMQQGVQGAPRSPMRFLHAGLPDHAGRRDAG